ncbi:hypothetical protein Hanom_Chr11g01025951 [Helianthus anomalus]
MLALRTHLAQLSPFDSFTIYLTRLNNLVIYFTMCLICTYDKYKHSGLGVLHLVPMFGRYQLRPSR